MYDVSFKPDIPKGAWKKRSELLHHLRVTVSPQPFHPLFLYDGGAIGFAHPDAAVQLGAFRSFPVRLRDPAVPAPDARGVTMIEFKRTAGAPITPTEINQVVAFGQDSPRRSSLLNFMQLVVRYHSNNMHANNGKAYFPDVDTREMKKRIDGHWLELRKGIFHSVRPAIQKVVIVVDTTIAAFWRSGFLADAVLELLGKRNVRDLEGMKDRDLMRLKKLLRGVFIREKKGNPPREGGRRSIKGFHSQGALYTFENDEGMPITIQQHYKRLYNIELRYPRLPGVILREHPRLEIVPMETCSIDPHQLFKKAIPEPVIREMVPFATLRPTEKLAAISSAAGHYNGSEGLLHAQMEVKNQPMQVPATILEPPRVEYGNGKTANVGRGQWNLLGKQFLLSPPYCHWAVLNLAPGSLRGNEVDQHIGTLIKCCNALGLPLLGPSSVVSENPQITPAGLMQALDDIVNDSRVKVTGVYGAKRSQEMIESRLFFVFCILESEAAGARAAIKNWGDVQRGVLTQCVRVSKLHFRGENQASQYYNNVALKINARLSGENSRVQGSRAYDFLTEDKTRPTMILGADVSHPAPGVQKPSVTSLVYNHDRFATKYTTITKLQDPRHEVIIELKEMMRTAILDFMGKADRPVVNIVFYRDGVSEGEYERIREAEIGAINEAIHEIWTTGKNFKDRAQMGKPVAKPKLSFIVVGKRHHTLMFPATRAADDEKTGNCKAGVVVNSGITQPTIRDFYLLSHSAIIGTSRSSHYIVLQDEVFGGGSTDALQELSFVLCHTYAKATRSVSIPAPVYYADLACGRDAFHFNPNDLDELRASDIGSVASSSEVPFDLARWKEKFRPYHDRVKRQMIFL